MSADDARIAEVRELLHGAGLAPAEVMAAGHDRGVAVIVNVPPERLAEVAALAPAIRAAGFRYVTLDITDASA